MTKKEKPLIKSFSLALIVFILIFVVFILIFIAVYLSFLIPFDSIYLTLQKCYEHKFFRTFKFIFGFDVVIVAITQFLSYKINKNSIKGINKSENKESFDIEESEFEKIKKRIMVIDDKSKDFLFVDFWDCTIRAFAGMLEMTFYVFAFTICEVGLIVGYLILKTLSYWRSESNKLEDGEKRDLIRHYTASKKEGLHTGVLRIATILQILFSYITYYFILK